MQKIIVIIIKIGIDCFILILEHRFTEIGTGQIVGGHLHLRAISKLVRLIIFSALHLHCCI